MNHHSSLANRFLGIAVLLFSLTSGLAFGSMTGSDSAPAQIIRVTGIPDENPTELARKNQPLVDYLEKQLGVKVVYIPVVDYGAAVSALAAGKIDFAWLGGFTHVQARIMSGAEPVVQRDIDRQFQSVFIANTAANVNKVEDCRGKTFAFGSRSSTSGHLMPRYFMLTQLHIDPEKDLAGEPVYSGAHDATVKLVESGKIQCGVLNSEVWKRMSDENKFDKTKVKVVWTTGQYVDYVWTARKGLPAEIVAKFKAAFLALNPSNPDDKTILDLQGAHKFVVASPSDFDPLEKIGRDTGLIK
jgi:phosphonate transport system substrate-binding protein